MEFYSNNCASKLVQHNIYILVLLLSFSTIILVDCQDDSDLFGNGGSISNNGGGSASSTLQNANRGVVDYFHTLKRSQEEIFRKIDWLTKAIEEKDHEDYKFRLKFSRKVHTLENKVLYMEQTFTQKVEEVVQKKVDEIVERLRYQYQTVSGSTSSSTATNSHGGGSQQHQNHQPFIPPQQSRYQQHHYLHQSPYQNNWGFYEHPITHKRVRDTNFGFEPPTRDLPLISLVATDPGSSSRPTDVRGASSSPVSSAGALISEGGREREDASAKLVADFQNKFESYDVTLQALKENITNLERTIVRLGQHPNHKEEGTGELHRLLTENTKDVNGLHLRHQELVQRMEHFYGEVEKATSKREQFVNESLKEMSAELKRQISSVKAYTKRHVQNITALAANQAPDKLRCAQTLLDELLSQLSKPRGQPNPMIPMDLIADQAKSDENGDFHPNAIQNGENLTKELKLQRQEILELKSEIARLNISQILLMRTVDEETLKRTVRPRDCAEIRLLRNVSSGVFSIFSRINDNSTDVYCDMETDGGGWTVIQRRGHTIIPTIGETRESFSRTWMEYEKGFGDLNKDFWLGLSNIASLCQLGVQQLRIELTNWSGETRHANYHYFKVANASEMYRINVSGYSGTAGDSLTRHNGMYFSTPEQDHDTDPRRHCAKTYSAGWWYYACFESNLNGLYLDEKDSNGTHGFGTGIIWQHWMGNYNSLKKVEMKIRNTFIGDNHSNRVLLAY